MKEKIIKQATELFLSVGFKSITMDELAHEMGISKKTIYSHFSTKNELVDECVLDIFKTISSGIDCICSTGKNPIEELYEVKKFILEHLRDEKSSPLQQLHRYYPETYLKVKKQQFNFMKSCVLENITKGMSLGVYRDNLDIEFISRIYFTGMIGIKDQSVFPAEDFPVHELHEKYLEYHLRGIVTPRGRKILNALIQSNHE